MKRLLNKLIYIILVCTMAVSLCINAKANTVYNSEQVEKYLDDVTKHQMSVHSNPGYGSIGGEWTVMSVARYKKIDSKYANTYISNLKKTLDECQGVLSERKYTEYSRVIIALTALGENPENFYGYNLLSNLSEYDKITLQGINGAIYALIALDCGDYSIPKSNGKNGTTREKLIKVILDNELSDGGWSITGNNADADVTAMAIQSLVPHKKDEKVKKAIDKALDRLSDMQNESGAYETAGAETCESTAQVLTALSEAGVKVSDKRFVKNNNTILDGLMSFYGNSGFSHTKNGKINSMATDQGMYALVSYYRNITGKNRLYDMKDYFKWQNNSSANSDNNNKNADNSDKDAAGNNNIKKNNKDSGSNNNKDSNNNKSDNDNKNINNSDSGKSILNKDNKIEGKSQEEQYGETLKQDTESKAENKTEYASEKLEDTNNKNVSENEIHETKSHVENKENKSAENNKNKKVYTVIMIIFMIVAVMAMCFIYLKKNKITKSGKINTLLLFITISVMITGCSGKSGAGDVKYDKTCKISIECKTILNNMDKLKGDKKKIVPKDGIIQKEITVDFATGDTVYDVLERVCKEQKILYEKSITPATNSVYIEGIANLYEFDAGKLSGWQYSVNGEFPNVACSDYKVEEGDVIMWRYTCDLGNDL